MPALQVSADQSLRGIIPLRKAKGSGLKSRIKEKEPEKEKKGDNGRKYR